jgi:hypothetical protein
MKKFITTIMLSAPFIALASDYGELQETNKSSVKSLVGGAQNYLVGLVGGAAMLFIIYGGFLYITSRGNKQQAERAKKTLTYAIFGLVLVFLARVIFNILNGDFIGTFIGGGNL